MRKGGLQVAPLSQNLAALADLLRDSRVSQNKKLAEANQTSLKQLTFFLQKYSAGLSKEEPLKAQRHALQFILPCAPLAPR